MRRILLSLGTFQGESEGGMTEIRFVPDDASSLDSMFTAMSECQVLHISFMVICRELI